MQPIEILSKICNNQKEKGSKNYVLHLEKMIFFSMFEMDQKKLTIDQLPFNFEEKLQECVQILNNTGMELFALQNQQQDGINTLIKAVDLLMYKNIQNYVKLSILGKLKVETFKNLSQVYQNRNQTSYALKSITYAAQLEEKLSLESDSKNKLDLASTFLNKGAIQSSLNKHDKSLESLNKAMEYLRQSELTNEDDQKQHNALKIVAFYNMGAENEHLYHKDKANYFYKEGLKLSNELDEKIFQEKFKNALKLVQ